MQESNSAGPTDYQARRAAHLIETQALEALIASGDPRVRIVDMRGYVRTQSLTDGSQDAVYLGAEEEYSRAHLPGAVYLDWTRDIVDLDDPIPVQAANTEKIERVFESAGIGDDTAVIAYDAHPASQFATRLWWLLRLYGHSNVRVLNGGWSKWTAEGRPTTSELPTQLAMTFTPRLNLDWRTTAEEVQSLLGSEGTTLLDARDEAQYSGAIRRGKRGGRIPGARHLPREAFFQADGTFRPPSELQRLVSNAGAQPDKRVVAYCNGGVAATTALFVLSQLGYPRLTNYDGSWNEWSERTDLPVERDGVDG